VPEPQKRTTFRKAKCKQSFPNRAMCPRTTKSPIQMPNASGVCPSFLWAATSAPCLKKSNPARSRKPLLDAKCSGGVGPSSLWVAASALCSTRNRAASGLEGRLRPPNPAESARLRSGLPRPHPCSTRHCVTSTCPSWDARCNGVDLLLKLQEFTSSECSMAKTLTTSCRPQKAAQCKAVPQGSSGLPVGLPRPQEGTVGSHI
jgi:hypothetical protein